MSTTAPGDGQPTETGTEPATKPVETPSDTAPGWVADLKRSIEELPGKLQASVSDDDKSGIAEAVHGLFERSGAFEHGGTQTEAETEEAKADEETEQVTTDETPPTKSGKLSGFARWFSGEE